MTAKNIGRNMAAIRVRKNVLESKRRNNEVNETMEALLFKYRTNAVAKAFKDLPNEILEKIFQFCSTRDFQNMKRVDVRWRSVCISSHMYRQRFFTNYGVKCGHIRQMLLKVEKTTVHSKISYKAYFEMAEKECIDKKRRYENRWKSVDWQEFQNWSKFSLDQLPK